MRARYRFDEGVIEAVAAAVPSLDVFEAASFGDLDRLTELLMFDPALVTTYSADGFTALHFAAFFGRPDAARFLLDRGADADAPGRGWMTGTALHSAASSRQPEVVAMLLDAGADADARQGQGWTALHAAARNGDLASVEALLAAGRRPHGHERRRRERARPGRRRRRRGRASRDRPGARPRVDPSRGSRVYAVGTGTRTQSRPSQCIAIGSA